MLIALHCLILRNLCTAFKNYILNPIKIQNFSKTSKNLELVLRSTLAKKVFDSTIPSMRKVDDEENNEGNSGHYVIASRLPESAPYGSSARGG